MSNGSRSNANAETAKHLKNGGTIRVSLRGVVAERYAQLLSAGSNVEAHAFIETILHARTKEVLRKIRRGTVVIALRTERELLDEPESAF